MKIDSTSSVTSTETNNKKNETQAKISFDKTLSSMNQLSEAEKAKIEQEEMEQLVKDILSVLRTGLTQSELEILEEALAKLESLIALENKSGELESEINIMISELEKKIARLQKKIHTNISEGKEESNLSSDTSKTDLEKRVDKIRDDIEKLKSENKIANDMELLNQLLNRGKSEFKNTLEFEKFKNEMNNDEINKFIEKMDTQNISDKEKELLKSIMNSRTSNEKEKDEILKKHYVDFAGIGTENSKSLITIEDELRLREKLRK